MSVNGKVEPGVPGVRERAPTAAPPRAGPTSAASRAPGRRASAVRAPCRARCSSRGTGGGARGRGRARRAAPTPADRGSGWRRGSPGRGGRSSRCAGRGSPAAGSTPRSAGARPCPRPTRSGRAGAASSGSRSSRLDLDDDREAEVDREHEHAQRPVVLGDEVVERGHDAVAFAALRRPRCSAAGSGRPAAAPAWSRAGCPSSRTAGGTPRAPARARSRGRADRTASTTSCMISTGRGAPALRVRSRSSIRSSWYTVNQLWSPSIERDVDRGERAAARCGSRRGGRCSGPGTSSRARPGSNSGTGSITCSSVSGPSRSNISAVVSPRSAPISTIRRAVRRLDHRPHDAVPERVHAPGGPLAELGGRGQHHDLDRPRGASLGADPEVPDDHPVRLARSAARARHRSCSTGTPVVLITTFPSPSSGS